MGLVTFLTQLTMVLALLNGKALADNCEDCGALVTLKTEKHAKGTAMPAGPLAAARGKDGKRGAVVFYNLFIKEVADILRVSGLVHEQLSMVEDADVDEIRINSMGTPVNVSNFNLSSQLKQKTRFLAHYAAGSENLTLRDLWSFCREKDTNPNQLVVYLHSKGSFHAHAANGKQRYYLTSGALSQECMRMPKQCNVCSTRMTPIPQPHTPGNMWAARCGYISKLMDPKDFREKMNSNELGPHNGAPWCVGRGRWADEHWVNSHPDCAPCDLDTNQSYVIGRVQTSTFHKKLKKAPRFPMSTYHVVWKHCVGRGESVEHRLGEYRYLYSRDPPRDWWGWRFFLQNSSRPAKSTES